MKNFCLRRSVSGVFLLGLSRHLMGEAHTGTSRTRGHYCWESSSLLLMTGQDNVAEVFFGTRLNIRFLLFIENTAKIAISVKVSCRFLLHKKRQFITLKNLIGRFPIDDFREIQETCPSLSGDVGEVCPYMFVQCIGNLSLETLTTKIGYYAINATDKRFSFINNAACTQVDQTSACKQQHYGYSFLLKPFVEYNWNTVVTVKNSP